MCNTVKLVGLWFFFLSKIQFFLFHPCIDHIDHSTKSLELFSYFKIYFFPSHNLFHLQTYYHFTVMLSIFNWCLHHHSWLDFFFCMILCYHFLFITIVISWDYLIFLFFYPSKLITNFTDITNFESNIHYFLFNFINISKFIYRGHPLLHASYFLIFLIYSFIFITSFQYTSRL